MMALSKQKNSATKLQETTRSRAEYNRISNIYGELRLFSGGMLCDVCLVLAAALGRCLTFAVCALAVAKQQRTYMISSLTSRPPRVAIC